MEQGDPRHVTQARAWKAALDAERAVFSEPNVMRTGLFDALRDGMAANGKEEGITP